MMRGSERRDTSAVEPVEYDGALIRLGICLQRRADRIITNLATGVSSIGTVEAPC